MGARFCPPPFDRSVSLSGCSLLGSWSAAPLDVNFLNMSFSSYFWFKGKIPLAALNPFGCPLSDCSSYKDILNVNGCEA